MILSGSCRRIDRRPRAKVRPFFSLTGICVIPGSWYSTGSSIVMILSSSFLISEIAAYSVVVFPEPVGPVTSTMPYGSLMNRRIRCMSRSSKPQTSSESEANSRFVDSLSRMRMTQSSPWTDGMIDTRKSTVNPPCAP